MAEDKNIQPFGGINFNVKKTESPCIIKVVGVGGGGGNAINHMYRIKLANLNAASAAKAAIRACL